MPQHLLLCFGTFGRMQFYRHASHCQKNASTIHGIDSGVSFACILACVDHLHAPYTVLFLGIYSLNEIFIVTTDKKCIYNTVLILNYLLIPNHFELFVVISSLQ